MLFESVFEAQEIDKIIITITHRWRKATALTLTDGAPDYI